MGKVALCLALVTINVFVSRSLARTSLSSSVCSLCLAVGGRSFGRIVRLGHSVGRDTTLTNLIDSESYHSPVVRASGYL